MISEGLLNEQVNENVNWLKIIFLWFRVNPYIFVDRLSYFLGCLCGGTKTFHWNLCFIDKWTPIFSECGDFQTTM